ncbi:interferon alpha/beta receptor 2 isoform X2 [Dermochelys coriacea]|uniref:interferon alpha/beta receptor 2 isoform X2 n=1 Tax=Dermochelys coriacea TaxID=27794 RepID=UPI0018E7D4D5|nr:interferon alpha/beta receptor 2 isoform X2 [Dermochelys coriacea]XP_038265430.1 interferon alpha/beta receptor 2 isoform X2 [Dermochelys coriacea]
MAVVIVPLCFCQLVYLSILTTILFSLPEASVINPPQKLTMNSQNFQHILSWEPGSNTTMPTYYHVMYIGFRSKNGWKIAKECSNITQLSCNLTKEYENYTVTYIAMVQSFTEHGVLNSSISEFNPYMSTYLGPPAVNLIACPTCINVIVKLPAAYLKERSLIDVYQKLDYVITVESFDRKEKIPIKNETSEESFSYVVGSLHSYTNYCVSVAVAASLNHHSIPSALKCIITRSNTQPGYGIIPILNGGLVSLVIGTFLLGLYKGGFICLKSKPWPKVLETTNKLHCSFHESDPEKVCSVQVMYKEMKKKEREYSDDDDDDSESDSESSGEYTRHGILGRIPSSHAKSNTFVHQTIDCPSAESSNQVIELLGSDAENSEEHQSDISENESTSRVFFHPSSEVNSSSTSGSSNSACFNINLNTVMLRDPDKTWDDSATLISHPKDAVDFQDSSASDALESKMFTNTVDVKKPNCHNISHEWQKPSVSDESDASDSEYIRR